MNQNREQMSTCVSNPPATLCNQGTREIPATPYMLHLLAALPRRNEWVFFSPTSSTGCLTEWLEAARGRGGSDTRPQTQRHR